MLKKLLAGLSAAALVLSITAFSTLVGPALAASADGASHSPAAAGESCVEFTSADIAAGSPLTRGAITATFASPAAPWVVASSGDPLATIEVLSNGAWSARTGSTTFSGDNGAAIDGAWVCTAPVAQPAAPAPLVAAQTASPSYVIVAWLMPGWSTDGTWPQKYFTSVTSSTPDLHALDSKLTQCGTSYQVDVYYNSDVTTELIAGGHLTTPGHPAEDVVQPSGLGITFELIHNADCYKPAVTWSVGTCAVVQPSTSVEQLAVLFDNTGSTVAVTFTIPSASISTTVNAGETSTVDVPIGTSGGPALEVYADGSLLATTDAIAAFAGCLPVVVAGDPGTAATCAADGTVANGAVNVDYKPGIVSYSISGGSLTSPIVAVGPVTALPPGSYTVTATAALGYVLSGKSSWVQTIDDPSPCTPPKCDAQLGGGLSTAALNIQGLDVKAPLDCDPPTLASWQTAATVVQPRCAATDGTLTVGDVGGGVSFFSEVDYFLNGVRLTSAINSIAPGSYTVTASPHTAGDGLTGQSVFPITVISAGIACAELTTLALTGTDPFGGATLAMGLLMGGLVLVAIRALRRPRSQG